LLGKRQQSRLRDIGEAMVWVESTPVSVHTNRPWVAWNVAAIFIVAAAVVQKVLQVFEVFLLAAGAVLCLAEIVALGPFKRKVFSRFQLKLIDKSLHKDKIA
jgi:hypothetical protein